MRTAVPLLACMAVMAHAQDTPPPAYEYVPGSFVLFESPNFGDRPEGAVIDTIVLHHTASSGLDGVIKWFQMPESQVSAHFTVGKDGTIVQHVSTYKRAWHAGKSIDQYGRENLNDFSVGIEMVNKGDGSEPWTKEQVEAVQHLVASMVRRFPIRQIVSHERIAVPAGRKNDPLGFPWESMRRFGVSLWY